MALRSVFLATLVVAAVLSVGATRAAIKNDIPKPVVGPCAGFMPGVCPAGLACAWDVASISFACQSCPAGTAANTSAFRFTCDTCPAGTWTQGLAGATECVPVPTPPSAEGETLPYLGAAAAVVEDDIPIPYLRPCSGFIPGTCDAGSVCAWNVSAISFACFPCAANTSANATAFRFECEACPAGTWTEGKEGASECVPEPAATPAAAPAAAEDAETFSVKGLRNAATISTDVPFPKGACSSFMPGTCSPGSFCQWDIASISFACQPCPTGSAAATTGWRFQCDVCPAGTWTEGVAGASTCSPVPVMQKIGLFNQVL